MKIESWTFLSGLFFFAPVGVFYGIMSNWSEPVGLVALFLSAGLGMMVGGYLWAQARRFGMRPEDNDFGVVETEAGELGEFAPQSIWPLYVAAAGAIVFLGLVTAWWVLTIGLVLSMVAVVGWTFEFYLGEHSH